MSNVCETFIVTIIMPIVKSIINVVYGDSVSNVRGSFIETIFICFKYFFVY